MASPETIYFMSVLSGLESCLPCSLLSVFCPHRAMSGKEELSVRRAGLSPTPSFRSHRPWTMPILWTEDGASSFPERLVLGRGRE